MRVLMCLSVLVRSCTEEYCLYRKTDTFSQPDTATVADRLRFQIAVFIQLSLVVFFPTYF